MSRVLIFLASAVCYLLFILTLPISLCITLKVCRNLIVLRSLKITTAAYRALIQP